MCVYAAYLLCVCCYGQVRIWFLKTYLCVVPAVLEKPLLKKNTDHVVANQPHHHIFNRIQCEGGCDWSKSFNNPLPLLIQTISSIWQSLTEVITHFMLPVAFSLSPQRWTGQSGHQCSPPLACQQPDGNTWPKDTHTHTHTHDLLFSTTLVHYFPLYAKLMADHGYTEWKHSFL